LIPVFAFALLASLYTTKKILPKLKKAGRIGRDMHKPNKPQIPEMGGIAIVVGFIGASLLGMMMHIFLGFSFNMEGIMASLLTVSIVAIIGIYDDLFDMSQHIKALLPLFAAVPLIVIEMAGGSSIINIAFIGSLDFGIIYPLLLIPLAVAVCSNLTNMLAGFNGLETGLGIIIFSTLSIIAIAYGQTEMAILSIAMLGALFGFIHFNWFPAKVFIGDVGTFSIGAALAAAVIVSDYKSAGAILVIPFVIDFFLKLFNRFPKTFAEYREGKLYAPKRSARGLVDLFLKFFGGLTEKGLVVRLLIFESLIAMGVILLYLKI
jgi:UDP-N-acetylglucosamine--dolichyl-phosphate N-acetylglucosaminephosphotransferase